MKQLNHFLRSKKFAILSLFSFLTIQIGFAQSGAAQEVVNKIGSIGNSLKEPIFNSSNTISVILVVVFALANGVRVYFKIQSGEDASKQITAYLGSIIFFSVVVMLIKMLFIDGSL